MLPEQAFSSLFPILCGNRFFKKESVEIPFMRLLFLSLTLVYLFEEFRRIPRVNFPVVVCIKEGCVVLVWILLLLLIKGISTLSFFPI